MARQFINRHTLKDDIMAGLVLGVESVPDGLAQGFLASINPIFGLYGYMMGTFSAAFFTSSVYMTVQATGAMSLVVASVPQTQIGEFTSESVFALALLAGIIMLAAGLLKLGSILRFVPNSVMVGFVNAVAILIILGQFSDLTGYDTVGPNKVAQSINLFFNLDQVNLPTLMIGLATIFLILTLEKTRLKALGLVAAMIVASLMVPLFGWDSVAQLQDIADIPGSLPRPSLPTLQVFFPLIIPAFSLAFVGLVQGASITQSYTNPDGNDPDASGDFVGQGVANLASGLFQGMPVGGSFSATALVVDAGAKSRFANIFAGITMAVVIVVFGSAVGYMAMPAMAGLLMVVGFRALKPDRVEMVWKTGRMQQLVMAITFISCLLVPLQYAVLFGVGLSLVLYVVRQSNKVTVKQWEWQPGELIVEKDVSEVVPANEITVLVPYGSLFFATASLMEDQFPKVDEDTYHAVVILQLIQEEDLGSTFLKVIERYATDLKEHDSKLIISGASERAKRQLTRTGLMSVIGPSNVYLKTEKVGEAITDAWYAGEEWINEVSGQAPHGSKKLPVNAERFGLDEEMG